MESEREDHAIKHDLIYPCLSPNELAQLRVAERADLNVSIQILKQPRIVKQSDALLGDFPVCAGRRVHILKRRTYFYSKH